MGTLQVTGVLIYHEVEGEEHLDAAACEERGGRRSVEGVGFVAIWCLS